MSDIVIVSVVRNWGIYDKLVRTNANCKGAEFVSIDNCVTNKPIPVRYNEFLDSYNYSHDAWFIFCHEDFEFLEDPHVLLRNKDMNVLYGPIGHIRVGVLGFGVQSTRGSIKLMRKNDTSFHTWVIGHSVSRPTLVDTFDCCCIIVHSSLVRKHGLRFDECLEFDMYVEDFCAAAIEYHRIPSYVIQMDACHHSDAVATERLWRHLPYLEEKYKRRYFTGTLTYFGTPNWQKRLQDFIVSHFRKLLYKCLSVQ